MTTDWKAVVNDRHVHVVLELVGGTTIAREMILAALALGKPVITANKALISAHGEQLFAAAKASGANLFYEASVAGGIPIIKALREGFVGNRITHIYGIVNGTCNYILSRMKLEGLDFAPALEEAQRLGYAEADPSLDIDGFDSEHKIGILASLAHGFWVQPKQIYVEGIRAITRTDMEFAGKLGHTIKLLGVVKLHPAARRKTIQVSVYPALVPNEHAMARVNHVFNAVFCRGDVVGDTLFYGRGAGKDATASAVLSDIADAVLDLKHHAQGRVPAFVPYDGRGDVLPIARVLSRYYLRFNVANTPATLSRISSILAAFKIGIDSVIQPKGRGGKSVPLILMTRQAPDAALRRALAKIASLPVVEAQPIVIRVENFL
jgi:homoserine dehydrogenase